MYKSFTHSLIFFVCLVSHAAMAQFSTWEFGSEYDPTSPYRNVKKDSKGNTWELISNKLLRYTSADTTVFQLPINNIYGINFNITTTDRVYVNGEAFCQIEGNQVLQHISTGLMKGYQERIFSFSPQGLHSLTQAGVKKDYPIAMESYKSMNAYHTDDATFLAITNYEKYNFKIYLYQSATDDWKTLGIFNNIRQKVQVHRTSNSLFFYNSDSLYLYRASTGLVGMSLKSDSLGLFHSIYSVEGKKELVLLYEKGIRTYDQSFQDFSFGPLFGKDSIGSYWASTHPYVFEQGKKQASKVLFQFSQSLGTDSIQSYFLEMGAVPRLLHGLRYKRLANEVSVSMLRDGKTITYLYSTTLSTISTDMQTFQNGVPGIKIALVNDWPTNFTLNPACSAHHLWLKEDGNRMATFAHDSYYVTGTLYLDKNKNGQMDEEEKGTNMAALKINPSGVVLIPDINGKFNFVGQIDKTYTLEVQGKYKDKFAPLPPLKITRNEGNHIGLQQISLFEPEGAVYVNLNRSRCQEVTSGTIYFCNSSLREVDSVRLEVEIDSLLRIGTPEEVLPDRRAIKFSTGFLPTSGSSQHNLNILWPSGEHVRETFRVKYKVKMYIADSVRALMEDYVERVLFCGFDPNDKLATPLGVRDEHYTLKQIPLQYTIRFENTGNDLAHHIVIQDTLSPHLDLSSFEVLGASHKVITQLQENGVVAFQFQNIFLPDTSEGKEKAQGFVSYRIKAKSGIPENTVVYNKASIYFDKNPAIVTNTTFNTMVTKIPVLTALEREQTWTMENYAYPNPSESVVNLHCSDQVVEIRLVNQQGQLQARTNNRMFDVSQYRKGLYFVQFIGSNAEVIAVQKIIVR